MRWRCGVDIMWGMSVRVRNFLLKSIPYLLSIAGGLAIFIFASDEIHDANLNDLINNISASLLSIPLVFLLYDYSNYLISRRVNRTLATGVIGRVNSIVTDLQTTIRNIAGVRKNVSFGEFERMLASHRVTFHRARITPAVIAQLTAARDGLDDIVYRIASTGAIAHGQVQILSDMARTLSHIIDQYRVRGLRGTYVKYLDNTLMQIGDWYDSVGGTVPTSIPTVGNNAAAGTN